MLHFSPSLPPEGAVSSSGTCSQSCRVNLATEISVSSTEVHKVLTAGALRAISSGSTQVDGQGPQVCWPMVQLIFLCLLMGALTPSLCS